MTPCYHAWHAYVGLIYMLSCTCSVRGFQDFMRAFAVHLQLRAEPLCMFCRQGGQVAPMRADLVA